ncbi:MAG: DUF255 domain-containing protein [Candidatus Aminicenantes bacterium]|nr:DUF255 domain-containing protein [Candidatus Aminicenantes bacterium]
MWWQEWSAEALATAREEQRPLFVSVGYSTCLRSHVMAGEAFSGPDNDRLGAASRQRHPGSRRR